MSVQLRFAAFSDVGLVRRNNQDGAYASPTLLALADGMGGAAAGDVASSVTIAHLAAIDNDVYSADDMLPVLRKALNDAHADLVARSQADPALQGLGTTCIAILHSERKLAMVHIGDSRAYLLRDGVLTQVTKDHTLVQYLVDQGQLTPEEAEHHPKRNVIMRALGDLPGPVELDESVREAVPGDRWLLSSDGLFGVVARDTIEHTLREYQDLGECGEHLIRLALAAGAPDNVTVVLFDVVDDSELTDHPVSQQPIVVGSAAIDYGRPSRGGHSSAAQAAELFPHEQASLASDSGDDDAATVSRRHLARLGVLLAIVAVLAAVVFGGYRWTQNQYYVASNQGYVTIFRGIPSSLGSLRLSSVVEKTDLRVDDLTPVAQDLLKSPTIRGSLADAREFVDVNLKNQIAAPATPQPSTSPAASASPSKASTP
jgi:Serine/threonine protein phosphatase